MKASTPTIRLLQTVFAVCGVVAVMAGTSAVAFAKYPTPHHELHCDPGNVDPNGGQCTVKFKDDDKTDTNGESISFSSSSGSVSPSTTHTDGNGQATAIFTAGPYPADCSGAGKDGHVKVTITGTEGTVDQGETGATSSASTTVQLQCPQQSNDKEQLKCDNVNDPYGQCTASYQDKDDPHGGNYNQAGQTICFKQDSGPSSATFNGSSTACSTTDSHGNASVIYSTGDAHCVKGSKTSATIEGDESGAAPLDKPGSATTTIQINCPQNASAAVSVGSGGPSISGAALAAGVVVVLVALSVAITGRLRIRRAARG